MTKQVEGINRREVKLSRALRKEAFKDENKFLIKRPRRTGNLESREKATTQIRGDIPRLGSRSTNEMNT
ncbi:MAG: hypothetical protein COT73_05190 [Bdellovibrio sp. CG10_big_fil_rev_8_21_14_0_10_47_8]|nr:MAG: hypothetical protein COT73_05190 [Bdellovibrio sp. CG10_big_fil_rev_8_21_14_0_10_47_8]